MADNPPAAKDSGSCPNAVGSEASLRMSNSVLRMAARPPALSSDSTRHRTLEFRWAALP